MCRIDYADDDGGVLISADQVKARKQHRCCECGRTIEIGEQYEYSTFATDGQLNAYKMCLHCQVPARWLYSNCSGFIYRQVGVEVLEHAEEYRRPDLARLVIGMNRKWRRFRSAELMPVPALPAPLA